MNIYLEEADQAMQRAARKAENLRREYNAAVAEWKVAKARYDRLAYIAMEEELKLARERAAAQAAGDTALAVLLQPR